MRDLTGRPASARPRRAGDRDRGAIGVLLSILLSGGVLFGFGSLVVDAGQLYANRADLQNGADAAALAVAKSCANGACNAGLAAQYAGSNAKSGLAAVTAVCGTALGGCAASTGAITDCPAAPAGVGYVDVHTATQTAGGGTLLAPSFARTLLGMSGYQGSRVYACARATYGAALQSHSLGVTLSYCAWSALTSGSKYGTEIAVLIHSSAIPCSGPAGQNVPGGFGWLASDSSCTATIDLTTSTASSDPGNNVSNACKTALTADVSANTVVFLPVFDSASGSGSGATYHLTGVAAFVLNGYKNLPGLHPDVVPGGMSSQCSGNNECLFGYFTQALAPLTDVVGTGTNYGATAIKLGG
jgi:Flp pilus assembly protein TadG